MAKTSALWVLAALLLLHGSGAQADVVYLKDGTRVQGTVVSATARDVEVYKADGTTEKIGVGRIARIDYQAQTPPAGAPAQTEPAPAAPPAPVYEPRAARRSDTDYGESGQELSLGLGLGIPGGSIDFTPAGGGKADNGTLGPSVDGRYLYRVLPRLSVGGEVGWLHRSQTSTQDLMPFADSNVSGNSILLLALAKYELIDHGGTRPYAAVGIGAHRTSLVVDATPLSGFAWSDTGTAESRRLYDASSWGFASALRLGVDFHVMAPSVFSLEAGWTALTGGNYGPTQAGLAIGTAPGLGSQPGTINEFTIVGRWGWRF